jgi:hypothetical protein
MVRRSLLAVAILATLIFAFAVTQAGGKKHAHGVIMNYVTAPAVTGPGSVGSAQVQCPGRTAVTGGGEEYVSGIATVEMGFIGNGYYVLVDNVNSPLLSQVNVQAACTAGTTRVRARPMSRQQAQAQLDRMVEQLEAAHRAAER